MRLFDESDGHPGPVTASGPLTRSQRMFWTARLMRPDRPVDNRVMKIEWRIALDLEAFRRALHALVERTDSLRLVFGESDGVPFQTAVEHLDPALEVKDFQQEPDPFAAAEAWLDGRSTRVLDLSRRVFDTALARVGEDHWIWYLNQHHIATDFTSAGLILERLSELYGQALAGDIAPAPPYASYLDFLAVHPGFVEPEIEDPTGKRHPADLLRLYPGVGERGDRDETRTNHVVRRELHLGPARLARARAALGIKDGRDDPRHQALLFNLFLAATAAFAARTSGQRSLTIGTPTHNRYLHGAEDVAGLFIRMLPLRIEQGEDWTFRDLLNAVRKERRAVFAAARNGAPIPNRRYNIAVNYLSTTMPDFHGVRSRELTTTRVTDSVGLDLNLTIRAADTAGDVKLLFDIHHQVLDAVDSESLTTQFLRVFDALIEDPGVRLDTFPLGGEEARETAESAARLVTESPPPAFLSVPDAFVAHADRFPAGEAVREGESSLTYADLDLRTRAVAAGLRRRGAGRGSIVALQMPRSLDLVVALLGVMRSGAAFCALDVWSPDERARWIVNDAGAELVLTSRNAQPSAALELLEPVVFEDLVPADAGSVAAEVLPAISPEDRAYVIYTSGTTGAPKGVAVSHQSLARFLHWMQGTLMKSRPVAFAFASSVAFDATFRFFCGLYGGGSVIVYPESRHPGDLVLADVLAEDAVDAAMTTPSQLRLLVERQWRLSRLRSLTVMGEPLTTQLAREAQTALGPGVEILNCYGPTEATLASTAHAYDSTRDTGATVPIGRPPPDVSVHLLDAGMNPVPAGVIGEIHIGGLRLSEGYVNQPALTRECFVPDPFSTGGRLYRTGDLARVDGDGNLVHHGRADDQVKINGVRIELAEVERSVCAHPRVTGCAAVLTDGDPPRLAAWYVAGEEVPPGELRATARRYIPSAAVPSFYQRIDALPLTANGKVDRRALPVLEPDRFTQRKVTPPRTPTEENLAALWRTLLGVDDISIEDDFFELGGDSLMTVRLIHDIERQFEIQLPLESIDQVTTLEKLASLVDDALEEADSTPTTVITPSDDQKPCRSGVDPDVLRRLRMFMTGWKGERVDEGALMFRLNGEGSLPPLIWCFNGQPEFTEMARELGPDQPVYAVRSLKGILSKKEGKMLQDRFVAERHVEEILRVCREGPYFIGGNCQATRIAMWMARHLIDRGKPVGLLCLMESTPLIPYPGRVALIFGRDSERFNRFKKFVAPEIGWRRFYRDVVWDVIPGSHGQYFQEPNIGPLCERIAFRLAEAREQASTPLPESAYAARLELVDGLSDLSPGERRRLRVLVRNQGNAVWRNGDQSGLFLVNHWLAEDGSMLVRQDGATGLPSVLGPGDSCEMTLEIKAPDVNGRLHLEIELSEQGVALFSERGVPAVRLPVRIASGRRIAREQPAEPEPVETPGIVGVGSATAVEAGLEAARLGRYETGGRLLAEAARDSYGLFLELGHCQLRAGQPRPALRSFRIAGQIRPGDPGATQGIRDARRAVWALALRRSARPLWHSVRTILQWFQAPVERP